MFSEIVEAMKVHFSGGWYCDLLFITFASEENSDILAKLLALMDADGFDMRCLQMPLVVFMWKFRVYELCLLTLQSP